LKEKESELAKFASLHPQLAARLQGPSPQGGGGATIALSTTGDPTLASLEWRAARIERQLRAASASSASSPLRPVPTLQLADSPELVAARRDLAEKTARYTDKHPDVIAARNRLRAAEEAQAALNKAAAAFAEQQHAAQDPPPPKNATDEAALRKELGE